MSSISNRINDLVEYFSKGNVSKFSAKVGFSEANVRNYINGTQPKSEFLSKLIEIFEINADWLLTGTGSMLKTAEVNVQKLEDNSPQSELEYYKSQLELTRELLKEKSKYIDMIQPLADQALKEMLERNKTK